MIRQRELFVDHIDRRHLPRRRAPNLHARWPSPPTRRPPTAPRLESSLLKGAMNRDSGAKAAAPLLGRKTVGNLDHVAGRSHAKFRIAPVHHDARDALPQAQILIPFPAKLTSPASPLQHGTPTRSLPPHSAQPTPAPPRGLQSRVPESVAGFTIPGKLFPSHRQPRADRVAHAADFYLIRTSSAGRFRSSTSQHQRVI